MMAKVYRPVVELKSKQSKSVGDARGATFCVAAASTAPRISS